MDDKKLLIILIAISLATIIIIVAILNGMQNRKKKKYRQKIEKLEIEKNQLESNQIAPHLEKVEPIIKNEKLETMYNGWKDRLDSIKNKQFPKITDMLLEADYNLNQTDYKATTYKIAQLELELYRVKTNIDFLLNEIKSITDSEEKNRNIITKLKTKYRELFEKFSKTRGNFRDLDDKVAMQFDTVSKSFEAFEVAMEKNLYEEVNQIIKSIDDMLNYLEIVLDELPSILILAEDILPKRLEEADIIYQEMKQQNYPLDYLNVEYNITEAKKKIADVLDRSRLLNLEDCAFELKVLLEYFDGLFNDFEKEKIDRANYEEINNSFKIRLDKINKLVADIFSQMKQLKSLYDLKDEDIELLKLIKEELEKLNKDYELLQEYMNKKTFAYSKLTKEVENLVINLANIEDKLDATINSIGSLRDDELRARQQLDEIKLILKDAKGKIKDYNLPIIPKSYYVEVSEAKEAIKEIIIELDKKPININVLNTRVDTARDLALKLFTKTKEMMKTAMFAEMAIVYGNRYRSTFEQLDKYLNYAEMLFYKGEYKKSLELTINHLNKVEPGIYDKLLSFYSN